MDLWFWLRLAFFFSLLLAIRATAAYVRSRLLRTVLRRGEENQRHKLADIVPLLQVRGGMTLREIGAHTGTGMFAIGHLMRALDAEVAVGKLQRIEDPRATRANPRHYDARYVATENARHRSSASRQ